MKRLSERFLVRVILLLILFLFGLLSARCVVAKPKIKAKFYDFSEHLIDGEVRKPQTLYTDVRQEAQFRRLLKLKRSFIKELLDTAHLPVFK